MTNDTSADAESGDPEVRTDGGRPPTPTTPDAFDAVGRQPCENPECDRPATNRWVSDKPGAASTEAGELVVCDVCRWAFTEGYVEGRMHAESPDTDESTDESAGDDSESTIEL